jgi:hypothetical protein
VQRPVQLHRDRAAVAEDEESLAERPVRCCLELGAPHRGGYLLPGAALAPEDLVLGAEQPQLADRPGTGRQFEQVLGEPEPLSRPFSGILHRVLRRPLQQHRHHRAQRQDREQRADRDKENDGNDHLQQQAGELQHPVQGPGRRDQAVAYQVHVGGHVGPVQVVDPRRPVHQVHELAAQPHLLHVRHPGQIQVTEVAEHDLGDERHRREHCRGQRRPPAVGQHVVGELMQRRVRTPAE